MPSRRRNRSPATAPSDPIQQFAASLRAAEAKEQAERERVKREAEEVEEAAKRAAEHAATVAAAHRELELAIEAARAARRSGKGTDAADERWRAAKAKVIELDTGESPSWAPADDPAPEPPADAADSFEHDPDDSED